MDKQKELEMYRDWLNNFLTVSAFAEHYNISEDKAKQIIKQGREYFRGSGVHGNEVTV
jgi:hypothetical protein